MWFETLNEALDSEGLLGTWKVHFSGIPYNFRYNYIFEDGSEYGHYVSIYRAEDGRYERPIHYSRDF